MLFWLLGGLAVAVTFATLIIRNAESHDKQRKLVKRPVTPNNWE